jgi:hypothetical protein
VPIWSDNDVFVTYHPCFRTLLINLVGDIICVVLLCTSKVCNTSRKREKY